jgi:hypothetical protein
MLKFLFDTDHLTLYHLNHPFLLRHIAAHSPGAVAISPISIEETLRGRLASLARIRPGGPQIQA